MAYLRLLVDLHASENVLDIGCGCGQMVLHLKDYLAPEAKYVGLDIHRPSITWCQKHISRRYSNFQFVRIDVRNHVYNPQGTFEAAEYQFPYNAQIFDVILIKSVFTHIRPDGVDNYLGEVARLLSDGGRCLATFFLLNEEQRRLAISGKSKLEFRYGDRAWRYVYEKSPESAVGYEEEYLLALLQKHGLDFRMYYGSWAGRRDGLSFQDMLVIRKSRSIAASEA